MMKNSGPVIASLLCIAALCGCLSDSNEKEMENQNYTVQKDSETPAAGQQTKEQDTAGQQEEQEEPEEQEEQQEKFERPVLPSAEDLPEGKEPVTEDISETPCADVSDEISCLRELAIKTGDTAYCEKLATGSAVDPRGRCIADVAKAKEDIFICDKLSGAKNDECVKEIAIIKDDISLCDKIYNDDIKDYCFHAVAVKRGDSSICGRILDETRKETCVSQSS